MFGNCAVGNGMGMWHRAREPNRGQEGAEFGLSGLRCRPNMGQEKESVGQWSGVAQGVGCVRAWGARSFGPMRQQLGNWLAEGQAVIAPMLNRQRLEGVMAQNQWGRPKGNAELATCPRGVRAHCRRGQRQLPQGSNMSNAVTGASCRT